MNEKIRWGILSTAGIGAKAVTPAILASRNGKVVAVASRDGEKAAEYAAKFGILRSHGSYEALLADPEIDAIYNPLPNSMHLEWTVKALEAGKHVLCEKPLGLNVAQCVEMAEAARRTGKLLMEAFMYRFHPRIQRTVELVAAGEVGELKSIRSAFAFTVSDPSNIRLQSDLGGGSLMGVGCYCVNASRTLIGSEPTEAQAFAVEGGAGVDVELFGVLRFEGGVHAQFSSGLDMFRHELLDVIGTTGALQLSSAFQPGTSAAAIEIESSDGSRQEVLDGVDHYVLMVEHFADCVITGEQPRYSLLDAAANMAAIEALYASAASGGKPQPVEKVGLRS